MTLSIDEQLQMLAENAVDLFSREELGKKLETARKENRPLRIKYGADPSAPDIHLGHVVGLNKLRRFQDCGHTVVFIIGDFTGMIGDPSGRSQTRKPLTREQVQANAISYQEQVFRILRREQTEIVFNSAWLSPMSFVDVIRLSAHVTVAQLLARDDFSKRYAANQPISLVEFLYPLVQAYDSVMVKSDVEIGGTDQLFNLLLGRELQKIVGQEPQVVMTLPLIEGLDGVNKMSKSLGNYIGVNEAAGDIFGKAMSISDELMWKYFTLVLNWSPDQVKELQGGVQRGETHPRDAKDRLAKDLVSRFHGEAAGQAASDEFRRVFSAGLVPSDVPQMPVTPDMLAEDGTVGVVALMVKGGLCASNGEARRLIQQGAVKIGEDKVTDAQMKLVPVDGLIIRSGKRGFVKLKVG
jgi:tyrosyl-tRNA synthetase